MSKDCGSGKSGALRQFVTMSHGVGIAFIALKLCGILEWSWWWVTAPIWIPWGAVAAIIVIVFVVMFILALISEITDQED